MGVANRSAWSITSNEGVPLPLWRASIHGARPPRVPWPTEDYEEVVAWLDGGGDEMAVSWLHRRWDAMSAERRKALLGRAPMTDRQARPDRRASLDGIEGAVKMAIRGTHGKPWPDLMSMDDVLAALTAHEFNLLPPQLKRQVSVPRVTPALKAAGAVRLFKEAVRSGDNTVRLWCMRASKVHIYKRLGPGKQLFDVYVDQRAGKLRVPSRSLVETEKGFEKGQLHRELCVTPQRVCVVM